MPQLQDMAVSARLSDRLALASLRAQTALREMKWRFVLITVAKIALINAVAVPVALWLVFCPLIAQHYLLFFPLKYGLYHHLEVDGIKPTEVYFRSKSGNKLHGLFYKKPGATFTCLLSHGNGGNVATRQNSYDLLLKQGCSIFAYDYSGYGKSEGNPSADAVIEDSKSAYDYVKTKLGWEPSRTILFGESLGTMLSTRLAATCQCAALILECPVYSVKKIGCRSIPYLKTYPDWMWPAGGLDSSKFIKSVHVPVLFVVGSKDQLTDPPVVHELYELANMPKRFLLVDGAGHGDPKLIDAPAYSAELDGFLGQLKAGLKG